MPDCTVSIAMDASAPLSLLCFPPLKLGKAHYFSMLWNSKDKFISVPCAEGCGTPRHCCSASGLSLGCQRGSGSPWGALGLITPGPMALGGQSSPFLSPAVKAGLGCAIMHMHEERENGSIYRHSAFFSLLSAWLCGNIKSSLSVWIANIPIHPPAKKYFPNGPLRQKSCLTGLLLERKLAGTNVDLLLYSSLWLDKRFLKIGLI